MKEKKMKFSSRWGFILSAVGSAVGMANVWGFPAKMGSNGGGAFLVAYLIFIALFSVVGLSAEYVIGRRAKTGTLGAYRNAWASRNPKLGKVGGLVGWLPLAGPMCIAIGYAVIISYILKAFWQSLTGELMTVDTGAWFESFSGNDYSVIPFHIIVVVGTLLTLLLGAKSIEKSNKVMMPVFFIIFVILAVRVAFLPGAMDGYKFIFSADWSALANPMTWIWAMGQAFFSLSVTVSGMIVYGAYLNEKEDKTGCQNGCVRYRRCTGGLSGDHPRLLCLRPGCRCRSCAAVRNSAPHPAGCTHGSAVCRNSLHSHGFCRRQLSAEYV